MTREESGLPSRKLKPENLKYCALTQQRFNDLVKRTKEIVDDTYKKKHQVAIILEAFDEPFSNTDDLAKAITSSEWKDLTGIHVDLYDKENYNPTLEIKVGREASWYDAGLLVDTLQGTTVQKVAVRESIRLLLQDYRRSVRLSSRVFAGISTLVILVGIGIVLRNYPKVYGQLFVPLIFMIPWGASTCTITYSLILSPCKSQEKLFGIDGKPFFGLP